MLAGRIKMDGARAPHQLERDGRKLDGFGPGSDDEIDTRAGSGPPGFGGANLPRLRRERQARRVTPERVKMLDKARRPDHPMRRGRRRLGARTPSIDGMLFAQVTDLHIGFDRDNIHELNVRRLNMVIDQLNAMRPKPSLAAGDRRPRRISATTAAPTSIWSRWSGGGRGRWRGRSAITTAAPMFLEHVAGVATDANGFVQYEFDHDGRALPRPRHARRGAARRRLLRERAARGWRRGWPSAPTCRRSRPPPSAGRYRDRLDERPVVRGVGPAARRVDPARGAGRRR